MKKTSNNINIFIGELMNCNHIEFNASVKEDLDNTRVYYFDDTDKHFKDKKGIYETL